MFQERFERRYIYIYGMEDAKLSIARIALRDLTRSRIKSNLYDYTRSGFVYTP